MNGLTPDQVLAIMPDELSLQSSETLFELKNMAIDRLASAKQLVAHLQRTEAAKYAARAQQLRLAAGKDSGVVHFEDDGVHITAELSKKVEWDQKLLADIHQRIGDSGYDPDEFIETSFHVSETKFNAWNQSLKDAFIPARTVKTGKPDFRLALVNNTSRGL